MKKHGFYVVLLVCLLSSLPVYAETLSDIENRLQLVEKTKNTDELAALEAELKPQVAGNKEAGFLLAKTLFLKEKITAENAGATPVRAPRLYTDGKYTDKAVLLIHGFTACPWEMSELGEFLQKQGINAYAVRLAGHGTRPEDLLKITWPDWYKSVEDGLALTKLMGKDVYVMGVSTGGALTVKLAVDHPEEIKGVVALAPAIYLQDWKSSLTGIAGLFTDYNVRPLEEEFKPYYYEERAMPAIYQLVKLTRHVRRIADEVTVPILIIQSKADQTVKPKGAEFLFEEVKSEHKIIYRLVDAPHVLTTYENPRQKEVFEQIRLFVQK